MSEAVAELAGLERDRLIAEEMIEEIPDEEEEAVEATDYAAVEKEEEKAYAEMLWNQVDSSQRFWSSIQMQNDFHQHEQNLVNLSDMWWLEIFIQVPIKSSKTVNSRQKIEICCIEILETM